MRKAQLNDYKYTFILLGVVITGFFVVFAVLANDVPKHPVQATENRKIKVAAVGDSNTFGAGVAADNYEKNTYPSQLQTLLGSKYDVFNYGVSGTTLINDSDAPYVRTDYYTKSQTINPDIVLIMLGTNDSTSLRWNSIKYEQDLLAMINTYKHLTSKPQVYLLTVPFAYINGNEALPTDINGDTISNQVVPIIKRVAQHSNTRVIDVYSVTKNHQELFPDKIHANAEGYGIIATQVYKELK